MSLEGGENKATFCLTPGLLSIMTDVGIDHLPPLQPSVPFPSLLPSFLHYIFPSYICSPFFLSN